MKASFSLLNINAINLSTLSIVLAVLAMLFGVFLFSVKTKNRLGNYLLGAYFISMAFNFGAYFLTLNTTLELIRNDFCSFTSRPLIYLYVLSVLYSDFKLQKKHLLHTLWFVIVFAIMISWYLTDTESQIYFQRNYLDYNEGRFIMYFSLIHSQVYIIAIFILLVRYKKVLMENYSNPNLTNYNWLLQMNIMLQGFFLFVFTKNMFRLYSYNPQSVENARILLVIFTIIFLCWLLLKALHAPETFRGLDSKIKLLKDITGREKQSLAIKKQVEELEFYMASKKPFLDSDLTIQSLANQFNTTTRDLSVLINYHFRQDFYNFINTYRINNAKELLSGTELKQLTISEIFYKVGFNSKSSFNTAFKKQVGKTPTEFRKTKK